MDLNVVWFFLLTVLLAGYAILDGFDFGVGMLHPLAKNDQERSTFVNSIGPLWDGNEVWLVTFGGALFAAFPMAYATGFSALYLPFMLLLFALILRAVSVEFRSKMESALMRRVWDWGFFGSSLLASLLFGVAVGNSIIGLPLDEGGEFRGRFLDFLSPYALLTGVLTVVMFVMHGACFLRLKVGDAALRRRIRSWTWTAWGGFLLLYLFTTIYTLMALPQATANFREFPWALLFVAVAVLSVANIGRSLHRDAPMQTFLSSCAAIASLVALLGVALFPNLIAASNASEYSLTIYNAASSQKTLWIMFVFALIGMPCVLGYTAAIYWTFRGHADEEGHY